MGIAAAAEETVETESATNNNKWVVISGIQFMIPLKPIYTNKGIGKPQKDDEDKDKDKDIEECCCTTPTTPESMIPALKCPGAPRKRKTAAASSRSRHLNGGVRDYFKPPELESVLRRCVERV